MIGIITRTSNRPKYFKRCSTSLINQPGIGTHYVLYDEPKDKAYLKDPTLTTHLVNKRRYQQTYKAPAPKTARPPMLSLHNLYFNEIYGKVTEDWVYHLDDDNYLVPKAFGPIAHHLRPDVDLIICKIKHFTGPLPRGKEWQQKQIRVCRIDTGCFIVRTNLMKRVKWDGWKCGDFRVIQQCAKLSRKTLWVDKVVSVMDQQNLARLNDMS